VTKHIAVSTAVLDALERRSRDGSPMRADIRRRLRADLERHADLRRVLPAEEATTIAEGYMADILQILRREAGHDQ
jgi:hypothetical protein